MNKKTKEIIAKMLTANTGKHFLDSGGAYGRHWERNQGRDFESEPEVQLDFRFGIDYTRSVYHFLTRTLDYEDDLTHDLYKFESEHEDENATWFNVIQDWIEKRNYKSIYRYNTYNGDCNLSQSLLFELVTKEEFGSDFYDTDFVILQIHNGCDIRGGYTAPAIFTCDIDYFLMFSDGYIRCENGHSWYTDDSYRWYSDSSNEDDTELQKLKVVQLSEYTETEEYKEKLEKQIIVSEDQQYLFDNYTPDVINPIIYEDKVLLLDEDGNGYCPICAKKGILVNLKA